VVRGGVDKKKNMKEWEQSKKYFGENNSHSRDGSGGRIILYRMCVSLAPIISHHANHADERLSSILSPNFVLLLLRMYMPSQSALPFQHLRHTSANETSPQNQTLNFPIYSTSLEILRLKFLSPNCLAHTTVHIYIPTTVHDSTYE